MEGSSKFTYRCRSCGEDHTGIPHFSFELPAPVYAIPDSEREARVFLTSDTCVVDEELFFVRGCLEIPVHGYAEPFVWVVWVSLSEANFFRFQELYEVGVRSQHGPWFGWLCSSPPSYPDCYSLKTTVHLRDHGTRPFVELEPTDHPLAADQRQGLSRERLVDICEQALHGDR